MNKPQEKARHIYTVSELTQDIKLILENTFGEVWVEGELSNLRSSAAGHLYPSLKDQNALLQLAIFSRTAQEIKFKLEDGLKVICFGRVEVYPPRGSYQLIVERMEPKGIGSLQLALEQLKKKLEQEGLFRVERKRPIPYLPGCIGIVTSVQGAAIRDILKVLERRFGDIRVVISPVRVQGEGAKEDITQAIQDLNRLNEEKFFPQKIEVMIVGRGGGSIEDLWAFNEEIVGRAIYNSRIPVISAVGHERDWTIADLVADLRAATPSVAAELALPKKEDLRQKLRDLAGDLQQAALGRVEDFADDLESLKQRLALLNPVQLLEQYQKQAGDLARQIYIRMSHLLRLKEAAFGNLAQGLSNLSPLNILGRGYSITFKLPQETLVKDSHVLKIGDSLRTKLYKGEITSKVTEVN
jgi:exodeoxyribonuclease VII large subunit